MAHVAVRAGKRLSAPVGVCHRPQGSGRGPLGGLFRRSPTLVFLNAGGCFLTTENVAILFTDAVQSREPSQRLLPETSADVLRKHFGSCAEPSSKWATPLSTYTRN